MRHVTATTFMGIFAACAMTWAADSITPRSGLTKEAEWVIYLTNQTRVKAGLAPLKYDDRLTKAAQWMAEDMATNRRFSHDDSLGRTMGQRINLLMKPCAMGENIAAGQVTPSDVMQAWMNSKGHRENILNPGYALIGVGFSGTPGKGGLWCMDLSANDVYYPVIINNEALETDSDRVSLYCYGNGLMRKMRFSNDRLNWSDWQDFTTKVDWNLSAGLGEKKVYIETMEADGTTWYAWDTIRRVTKVSAYNASTPKKRTGG